jgi:thiosulfate/3-mercaptopyruvate sulfurtransferase
MNMDTSANISVSRRKAIRLALCWLAAPAAAFFVSRFAAASPQQAGAAQDYPPASILEPSQLVALLARPGEKPLVICVGFEFLFNAAHIPGALFIGPGRNATGLSALQKWADKVPRNKPIVLYCGCCPWNACPNVRPAYAALKQMGFSQLKVVRMKEDFARDWVQKGYPTEKK